MAKRSRAAKPLVGVIMGSSSDWETMQHAARTLEELGVPHECRIVSAHRTPDWLFRYASTAEDRGLEVIIAGAGGAAHLPGMAASKTVLPVLGVPIVSATRHDALNGLDSLLSIVQMPGGVPVGTLALGKAGAINAGLLACAIVSASRRKLRENLRAWRTRQTEAVLADRNPAKP
jgi:5-(carboxyamino)imidazole ribonucleotide mutase